MTLPELWSKSYYDTFWRVSEVVDKELFYRQTKSILDLSCVLVALVRSVLSGDIFVIS